jgi:hypothetical protein
MTEEVQNEVKPEAPVEAAPVQSEAPSKESRIHAVLKDIEDGLETVEQLPEHVRAWLKAKLAEVKSHL